MSGINTDLAGNLPWNIGSGFKNTFTITVTLSGSAYSLSGRTFSLQIRNVGSLTNLINLTQGSGITNGGVTGILTIVLTAAQSATLGNNVYDWQLSIGEDETRWLSGTVNATNGPSSGETSSSVTVPVSLEGTALSLEISLAGVSAASDVSFTPTGTIAATDVQTAIAEVATDAIAREDLKQNLVNSATALVDGATIDLTAIKHTLATASSRTFTISYTGDDITLEITLSAASATQTFPATSLCVSEGVASGNNTLAMSGASGDKYMVAIKKVGSAYYVVAKNFGQ